MSHREHVTYFISGCSKNSESVESMNQESSVTVSIHDGNYIRVFGILNEKDKELLEKHFEVYDNINNELELLEE